jgi:glycosyltransferase involved in cell wall biosynthesis
MLSIVAFPAEGHVYLDLFYAALRARGVKVVSGVFSGRWLLRNLHGADYLHLHWPSFLYARETVYRTCRDFALFLFLLALARWRGIGVIWTVHNLMPHQRCILPFLDELARWLIVRQSDRFLIHGPSAASVVEQKYPAVRGRTTLIQLGHFIGYYPDTIGREQARAQLGLSPADRVFLFTGVCRPNKNLHGLVAAFARLPGTPVLLIASKFPTPEYENLIRTAIEPFRERVILHAGFVPDDKFQLYFGACDVVVMPYLEILTSAMALLAISFGRPVVAVRRGALIDVVTPECGRLYDPDDPDGLLRALQSAMEAEFDETSIREHARSFDWDEIAATVLRDLKPPRWQFTNLR